MVLQFVEKQLSPRVNPIVPLLCRDFLVPLFRLGSIWGIRNAVDPFEDDDAQRPDVDWGPVAGAEAGEHLGRRVLERAAESLQQSGVGCDLSQAEIGDDDFEERSHLDQEVLGFEIAVGYTLYVEVAEAVEDLSKSANVSLIVSDARIGNVPKRIVGHDDGGLWCLPKFNHLHHIRLCGDQFHRRSRHMHGSILT